MDMISENLDKCSTFLHNLTWQFLLEKSLHGCIVMDTWVADELNAYVRVHYFFLLVYTWQNMHM